MNDLDPKNEVTSEAESVQSSEQSIFIFHGKRYFPDALALSLGLAKHRSFQKPEDLLASLKENPTHIIICEHKPEIISEILGRSFVRLPHLPIIVILSLSSKSFLKRILEPHFPEFSSCINNGHVRYCQLPCSLNRIEEIVLTPKETEDDIRHRISCRREKEQDVRLRHGLANCRAASRILNGAILSGDYDLRKEHIAKRLRNLYSNLINNSERIGKEQKKAKIAKAMTLIEDVRGRQLWEGFTRGPELTAREKGLKRILIIDDEKDMWEPVWLFVFGKKKSVTVADGCEAVEKISKEKFDIVLLDVNLEDQKENGIEILQRIKHEQFDLPVIMMTAYDNAELTKMCFRFGAYSYFVKELRDDKDSVKYYQYIKELVSSVPFYDDPARKIWRKFVELEPNIEQIDRTYGTQIGFYFKRAYYLFTIDDEHFIPVKLLIPEWLSGERGCKKTSKYNGVAYNASLASDQVFIANALLRNRHNTYEDAYNNIIDAKTRERKRPTFTERAKRSKIRINAKGYLKKTFSLRHSFSSTKEQPWRKRDGIECLNEVLELIKKLPKTRGLSDDEDSPDEKGFEPKPVEISVFLKASHDGSSSHEKISSSGAQYLWKGLRNKYPDNYGEKCETSKPPRVLFIDDEGNKSAWNNPLRAFFDIKGCKFNTATEYNDEIDLSNYDLVLLDLVFNNDHEKGIEYLRQIRDVDVSIPVIMLTGDDSAYYARRCLLNGADDYFSKEAYGGDEYFGRFERIIMTYLDQVRRMDRGRLLRVLNDISGRKWNLNEEKLERIKKSKGLASKHDTNEILRMEKQLLSFPLSELCFYYLLQVNQDSFIDLWRVDRLLSQGSTYVADVHICLGRFVEYVIRILSCVQGVTNRPDAGYLITQLKYPKDQKDYFQKLWLLRCEAKTGHDVGPLQSDVFAALEKVLSRFQFYFDSEYDYDRDTVLNSLTVNQRVDGEVLEVLEDKKGALFALVEFKNPVACGGITIGIIFGIDCTMIKGEKYDLVVEQIDRKKGDLRLSWPVSVGDICTGKVARFGYDSKQFCYGAFVEIKPGLIGLLHESSMIGSARPDQVLAVGDSVQVKVDGIKTSNDRRLISLEFLSF